MKIPCEASRFWDAGPPENRHVYIAVRWEMPAEQGDAIRLKEAWPEIQYWGYGEVKSFLKLCGHPCR